LASMPWRSCPRWRRQRALHAGLPSALTVASTRPPVRRQGSGGDVHAGGGGRRRATGAQVRRFLPFAARPRSCPGRPLAEVSAAAGARAPQHACLPDAPAVGLSLLLCVRRGSALSGCLARASLLAAGSTPGDVLLPACAAHRARAAAAGLAVLLSRFRFRLAKEVRRRRPRDCCRRACGRHPARSTGPVARSPSAARILRM